MGSFGWQEILVILVIILILFGAKRLPELAKSLGQSMREFKKSVSGIGEDSSPSSTAEEDKSKTAKS
jgi:sec-independent protein translocase protein TatA